MNKNILGIDLGTSSVKMLLRSADGSIRKAKSNYKEKSPEGWMEAIRNAFHELKNQKVDVISLSSQVGTYIVNEKHVIGWDSSAGKEELEQIKKQYTPDVFIKEIAMPHPEIISYPIPRLMYIKKHFEKIESICQPKDYIGKQLTGRFATDKYSYRGLAHTNTGKYSKFFLDEIGIDEHFLPPIISSDDIIGYTTKACETMYGIPRDIPVLTGLNDFFASIVGMQLKSKELFDISGTSEHVGILTKDLAADTKMVSGVYFDQFIHYGVTASSGASLDFGLREFGLKDIEICTCLNNNPPIFTPYINGERAPIFDSQARGVFFGIHGKTSKNEMAYSILEGVAFSLYHIYEYMGFPEMEGIRVCGGASNNDELNRLKAEIFGVPVHVLKEKDTSALGAVALAAKKYGDIREINEVSYSILPTGKMRKQLMKRYDIYKNIYPALKEQFQKGDKI